MGGLCIVWLMMQQRATSATLIRFLTIASAPAVNSGAAPPTRARSPAAGLPAALTPPPVAPSDGSRVASSTNAGKSGLAILRSSSSGSGSGNAKAARRAHGSTPADTQPVLRISLTWCACERLSKTTPMLVPSLSVLNCAWTPARSCAWAAWQRTSACPAAQARLWHARTSHVQCAAHALTCATCQKIEWLPVAGSDSPPCTVSTRRPAGMHCKLLGALCKPHSTRMHW